MLCTQWWLCWIIYLNSIRLYVIRRSPQQHTTVRPVATSPSTSHWLWLVEKSIFGKSANRNPSHFLSKTELSSYIRGAIPHTTYGFDTTTCVVQMNTQHDAVSVSFFLYFTYRLFRAQRFYLNLLPVLVFLYQSTDLDELYKPVTSVFLISEH